MAQVKKRERLKNLKIPESLHKRLVDVSTKNGQKIGFLIAQAVTELVERKESENGKR